MCSILGFHQTRVATCQEWTDPLADILQYYRHDVNRLCKTTFHPPLDYIVNTVSVSRHANFIQELNIPIPINISIP